ncbi:MAG: hypothetical protein ACFFBP_23915 [Promethearchaeota archaeon]
MSMDIVFLNKLEARSVLTTRDEFILSLSPFDRASRLKTESNVSQNTFLDYISKQVLDWGSFECAGVEAILESIISKLDQYTLKFPRKISIIKTTGKEEGNAAYCRGNAIVLPQSLINTPYALKNIITHELFHIFSKNDPEIRSELYNVIGFFDCPELEFPEELRGLKITNPDAPLINCYLEDNELKVMPILYSNEPYNLKKRGEFFDYLEFRLLGVDIRNECSTPIYKNGKLQLFHPDDIQSYVQKIGLNTDYIIHPEEILAENFVLLLNNSMYVRSPEILENINNVLTQ